MARCTQMTSEQEAPNSWLTSSMLACPNLSQNSLLHTTSEFLEVNLYNMEEAVRRFGDSLML